MKSITTQSIEKYIYEGKIPQALDYMITAVEGLLKNDDQLLDQITHLKSRLFKLEEEKNKGLLKYEDYTVEYANLTASIIELKTQISVALEATSSQIDNQHPELELLIYTNAYGNTIKDLDIIEKTFHSSLREKALEIAQETFALEHLSLIYEIVSIEVLEVGVAFATANVIQITKDTSDSFFRDNSTKASHTFLKENGKWKFFNTLIQEIKYL